MKKMVALARHFGGAMKEIYSPDNHILFYFSVVFAMTVSGPLAGIASMLLKITEAQKHIWLTILLTIAITSQYASHWIYHRYVRSIILKRGWREDSYLHAITLMIIMQLGFSFPFILTAALLWDSLR